MAKEEMLKLEVTDKAYKALRKFVEVVDLKSLSIGVRNIVVSYPFYVQTPDRLYKGLTAELMQ